MQGQFGEGDAWGMDGVQADADGVRVEADFADEARFGDHGYFGAGGRGDGQGDDVGLLADVPLWLEVSVMMVEKHGGVWRWRELTSQFWARRAVEGEWYERAVQPSMVIIPMEISERMFIARISWKARPAPSATATSKENISACDSHSSFLLILNKKQQKDDK